ncbi:MAG: DegV family protein [Oscillospiraceae bacterium]|jgi:DegV family protein with EDD domain|nr:DegV family protein [Oscillospiraceae bacterium]
MQQKVIITADNACDLGPDLLQKYNIRCSPFYIIINDKEYLSDIDITPDKIFEEFSINKILPKTAALGISQYIKFFQENLQNCVEIVHISIGAKLSSAYQNSLTASKEFNGKVHVVDSENLSTGIGLLIVEAAIMARSGLSGLEIYSAVKRLVPKIHTSFILNGLDYMKAGGRCSSVAALGANLLSIKPCIAMLNGSMSVHKKYRGTLLKAASQYVNETLDEFKNINTNRIFITHCNMQKDVLDAVYRSVKSRNQFDEILITAAGSTVTSHCGPDVIGILFLTN